MIGAKIIQFATLDSTNNYVAKQLLAGTYEPGVVILAHFQTEGRGRRGKFWQSSSGENLTFSFALDTDFLPAHQNFILAKAVSVGIYAFLESILNAEIRIKWPNDMLVSGRKIAGILIESKWVKGHKKTIVGIGLNINQTHFPEYVKATSIALELGQKIRMNGLLQKLLNALNAEISLMHKDRFTLIENRYIERLYGTDSWVNFHSQSRNFKGQIRAVDQEGVLLVKSKSGGAVNYRSNEVRISY